MSYVLNIPIIPVNHMVGHVYANWIEHTDIAFPAIALVVSGGHTDLLLLKNHGDIILIGGTRDDAAGEAFDKTGRLLGLSYPAGPVIEKKAKNGNKNRFHFPRPLMHEKTYDFSFSGLKTAVLRQVMTLPELYEQTIADVCVGVQDAIIDVLVKKTIKAAMQYNVSQILLSGGVAANETLTQAFHQEILKKDLQITLFCPSKKLCTDNAAMIASAGYFNAIKIDWRQVRADPELYFQEETP